MSAVVSVFWTTKVLQVDLVAILKAVSLELLTVAGPSIDQTDPSAMPCNPFVSNRRPVNTFRCSSCIVGIVSFVSPGASPGLYYILFSSPTFLAEFSQNWLRNTPLSPSPKTTTTQVNICVAFPKQFAHYV